jgi:hypothetical protein
MPPSIMAMALMMEATSEKTVIFILAAATT